MNCFYIRKIKIFYLRELKKTLFLSIFNFFNFHPRLSQHKKKRGHTPNNIINSTIDVDNNLLLPSNNNFRQNPEYFFFKLKREGFRNENLKFTLRYLNIELDENQIQAELAKANDDEKADKFDVLNNTQIDDSTSYYSLNLLKRNNQESKSNSFLVLK